MLKFTEEDVRRLLPMREAVRLVREAFEQLAAGSAINQPRHRLMLPTGSALHYMAGGTAKYFGAKVYATNPAHGAHFTFLLYRAADAAPLAIFEANYLGQIRTGAASAVATQLMARPDSKIVGLIGSGFQARSQLAAIASVMPLQSARVWSRSAGNRERFADESSDQLGIQVSPVGTAEEAVRGADIVVTATNARDPVLDDAWIAPGTHVNAMGSNQPNRRELPASLVRRADWIAVDSKEQARAESGDLLLAFEDSWNANVIELHEIVAGRIAVRSGRDEITLFKSNGLAVEDVVAAGYVYERASREGRSYS